MLHEPKRVYYEPAALDYPLGQQLHEKYGNVEWIPIENHNNITQLQQNPNSEFARMKQAIVVAVRKTHKYTPNHKTSDFLVPYTSSGCSAACLYCYLVCSYNKCSYLRLFVNREEMMAKLKKTAVKAEKDLTFEIGSNSDLVLENQLTGNLEWTIEEFGAFGKGYLTLPTKFSMVDPLLSLRHNGRTILRMSVNPEEVIRQVEFGTSPLRERIDAINKLCEAGYRVGLLIAPVILLEHWEDLYEGLLVELENHLSDKAKHQLSIEVIFMTYCYVHRAINSEAFPTAIQLYDKEQMTGRGRGRYCYKPSSRQAGELFLRDRIQAHLPQATIAYIV